jgi:hypothetical protein
MGVTVSRSRPFICLFVNLVVDNSSSHQLPHNPGSGNSRATAGAVCCSAQLVLARIKYVSKI